MKTINIENTGITNSAMAVSGNEISVSELLRIQNVNMNAIIDDIVFWATHDEKQLSHFRPIEERIAEKIYTTIEVAKGWSRSGLKVVK